MRWLAPPLLWLEIIVITPLVFWCIYRFSKRRGSRTSGLRDWVVYIAIGIAVVTSIALFAIYGPDYGPEKSRVVWKWIGFAVNTIFVFGYALNLVRPLWRRQRLWTFVSGIVLLHGITGWFLISQLERVPLAWYVPVDLAEIWAVLNVIEWAFKREDLDRLAPPTETQNP